ncbi:MAG: hypothetical protein WA139_01020 [Candidatus Aenigmatarchaeota archaeon]
MKSILLGSLIIFSLFILPISVNADSNGLAGYWKFDEGSGASAFDSSGNGLTGTISGAAWVDGISGKALNFSGVSDYFTMPANSKLTFPNGNLDSSGSATYRTDRTDCSFDVGNFLGCQTAHDNFVGAIDEVKIYSRPLSASEILSEYQSFPTSSSSNSTTTNTSNTSSSSTWCTNWINAGCGISPCSSNQMKQTQQCGYSTSGASSAWENYQCVANETCSAQGSTSTPTTDKMLKTIVVSSAICTNGENGDKIYFTVQNVGTKDILAGELKVYVDGVQISGTTPDLTTTGLAANSQMQVSLNISSYSKTRTLSVQSPSNAPIIYMTCSGSAVCPMDVKQCPDGSYVGRNRNVNCEFYSCPTSSKQVQCVGANLDVKKADVSYDFSDVSSTANITVYNSGSEDLYNFSFGIITDKGIYTFNSINQYSETYPLAKGTATLFKTISSANNAPSSIEAFNTLRITALCKKDYRISTEINMQSTDSSSSLPSISPVKEVDKTVLLDVVFSLEQVKIKLDSLKDSALAISEYYGGKNDTAKAGKWLEISNMFNGVVNSIDGITAEIKQNKDNITADFIQKVKGEVAGVKADISSVIDKILEVM